MKQDIQVIRDSIGKIVSMLTSRAIKVTQRGVKAYVAYDPKTGKIKVVNVPYLPDDATPEFIAAVQGFLDHEVGHVLFTDQKVVIAASKLGAKVANLANIVEDVFIERKMTEAFQGSSHNLEQVRKFYLERICGKGITDALAAGDQKKAEGYAFVAAFRAWAGQTSAQDFIKQPHVAPLVEPLKAKLGDDILRKLTRVSSSQECLDLALEVKKALTLRRHLLPRPRRPLRRQSHPRHLRRRKTTIRTRSKTKTTISRAARRRATQATTTRAMRAPRSRKAMTWMTRATRPTPGHLPLVAVVMTRTKSPSPKATKSRATTPRRAPLPTPQTRAKTTTRVKMLHRATPPPTAMRRTTAATGCRATVTNRRRRPRATAKMAQRVMQSRAKARHRKKLAPKATPARPARRCRVARTKMLKPPRKTPSATSARSSRRSVTSTTPSAKV
ncbi:hypothetical protein [Variovorax paradoxus]|nr:hypothetical protein [Variovorax paradoxus]